MNIRGLAAQLSITIRLYLRNTMGLVYGYAFPLIFLVAFYVLYRYDRVPLLRHMGELLTIAILGGACFGLPTSLVSERERGVWRRYRLTPVSTVSLVTATVIARFGILLSSGLLQLTLAVALGMPWPVHPLQLLLTFSVVAFAFLGLGLVIAMLADNVPAVQALGQCIFLPMLIIGGIAVRLDALPEWAQHVSAFFPGRYAVAAIQASVSGRGLDGMTFNVSALMLIGAAGCLAAAGMFRWDASQRFWRTDGKRWLAIALAAWVAVGIAAETRGDVVARTRTGSDDATVDLTQIVVAPPVSSPAQPGLDTSGTAPSRGRPAAAAETRVATATSADTSRQIVTARSEPNASSTAENRVVRPAPPPSAEPPASAPQGTQGTQAAQGAQGAQGAQESPAEEGLGIGPPRWQDVTPAIIDRDLRFDRLPPDSGVVTPIASVLQEPDPALYDDVDVLAATLPTWAPGLVADPVQRVRNLLYVAAVADVFQLAVEQYIPAVVFAQAQASVPRDTLIQVLYWIAVHPDEGDASAMDELQSLGLSSPSDPREVRARAAVYAVKLLGQMTGKRPAP